jgi:hypothetical protein
VISTNTAVTRPFTRNENGGQKLYMDFSFPELFHVDTQTEKEVLWYSHTKSERNF